MRQCRAHNWLTVTEILLELQSVELPAISPTGGQTGLKLQVNHRLTLTGVSVVDRLGGVEDVTREEGDHSVTALCPDREPGGEAGLLSLLAVLRHRPLQGEVEKLAELVDLRRGQPELGLVVLLEEHGWLAPLLCRHLLLVLRAGRQAVQLDTVEDCVKPSVSLLLQVSRSQPVSPLLQSPEVRDDPQVLED